MINILVSILRRMERLYILLRNLEMQINNRKLNNRLNHNKLNSLHNQLNHKDRLLLKQLILLIIYSTTSWATLDLCYKASTFNFNLNRNQHRALLLVLEFRLMIRLDLNQVQAKDKTQMFLLNSPLSLLAFKISLVV